MPSREWSCQRCHAIYGRVTVDRAGRKHLHLIAGRVESVKPTITQTWIIGCLCGHRGTFYGYQVHIEDDREKAA